MGLGSGLDRTATANGLRLHYVEWPGAGEPLLLVHGLASSARSLAGIAAALAPARRVLAPDLRGRDQRDVRLRERHRRIAAPTLVLRATSGLAEGLPPVSTASAAVEIARAVPDARGGP